MKMALAVVVACGVFIVPAYGDDFGDFRIPKHRVYSIQASGEGSLRFGDGHASPVVHELMRATGGIRGSGYWLLDSDPLRARVDFDATVDGRLENSRGNRQSPEEEVQDYKVDDHLLSQSWTIQGDTRLYPWPAPVGFTLGGFSGAYYGQSWDSRRQTRSQVNSYWFEQYDNEYLSFAYHLSAKAKAGIGRVRDVSTIYVVHVLEQRLLQDRVLTRDLSNATRNKLTALFYFEGEYNKLHDRPAKFFWEEVERILLADGALRAEGLDAYSLYRLTESFLPSGGGGDFYGYSVSQQPRVYPYTVRGGSLRQRGYHIAFMFEGAHDDAINRRSTTLHTYEVDSGNVVTNERATASRRDHSFDDQHSFGPALEIHYPLGMHWQFDAESEVLFPQNAGKHAIDVRNYVQAVYLVADRWQISTNVNQTRTNFSQSTANRSLSRDSWYVRSRLDVAYYIEDNVRIFAVVDHAQHAATYSYSDFPQTLKRFDRDTSVSLGLTYRFAGGLDAPGIVAPSRLLPRMER